MLTAIALVIFVIEAQIPPLAPIPGIKLGLANIVTLFTILTLGRREAFIVMTLRIILGSVFTGSMMSVVYSAAGGALCFAAMSLLTLFMKESMTWFVSVIGAICHNIGQLAAAVTVTGTMQILWYMPLLTISAIVTGLFTGIAAQYLLKRGGGAIKKLMTDAKQP